MKCTCCRWPTPLSRLDLFSRRCDVCAWLRKRFPKQPADAMRRAGQNRRAGEEIARGTPPDEVAGRLVELGRTPEQSEGVVRALSGQRAAELQKLRERLGLPDDTPDDEIQLRVLRAERRRARGRGALILSVGVLQLAAAGFNLYLGEVVGLPGHGCYVVVFTLTGGTTAFLGLAQLLTGRAEFEKAFAKWSGAKKG